VRAALCACDHLHRTGLMPTLRLHLYIINSIITQQHGTKPKINDGRLNTEGQLPQTDRASAFVWQKIDESRGRGWSSRNFPLV